MDCSLMFCSHLAHARSISVYCVSCVYVCTCVCVCVPLLLWLIVCVAPLTHTHNTHPLVHTRTCPHTQEQSIPPSSAVEKKPFVPEAPPEG